MLADFRIGRSKHCRSPSHSRGGQRDLLPSSVVITWMAAMLSGRRLIERRRLNDAAERLQKLRMTARKKALDFGLGE